MVPLPDYEAGNDVPNEVGPMEVTTILGERIEPKWKPPRAVVLPPLWHDVDGADLVTRGLGRVCEGYYWRQTIKMVRLEVKVPEGTSARDLRVTIEPTRIAIAAARADGGGVLFDEELFMKIYVGSNADEETSIWELQDKRVVVFHLVKWHALPRAMCATRAARGGPGASSVKRSPLRPTHTAITTTRRTIGERTAAFTITRPQHLTVISPTWHKDDARTRIPA